jgi:branched-chain amino acid transport system substrate-binding protein
MRMRCAALAGSMLVLAACSSTSSPASNRIAIGIDLPISGADATSGVPTENGALLAIEQAQKAGFGGGRYVLASDVLDDTSQGKHDPAAGAQNVKTFIADGSVLGVVGPYNSNVAKAEIPLTNDAGLAQIGPATTSDGLTLGAAAAQLRTSHPDANAFFRVCTNDAHQGGALAQFARKLHFAKAFVIDDDETYGVDLADNFVAAFGKAGGTVAGREHITANQQDYKALLTKVKSFAPDVVFFGGTTSTGGGLIRRQMADVGLGGVPFMGGDGIADDAFETVAGTAADGTYFTVAAPDPARLPQARTFVAAYKARFHSDVGSYSANAYAATRILLAAIDKAIRDAKGGPPIRAAVLANVAATRDFQAPIGTVSFDPAGDLESPVLTLQKVDGGRKATVDVIAFKS